MKMFKHHLNYEDSSNRNERTAFSNIKDFLGFDSDDRIGGQYFSKRIILDFKSYDNHYYDHKAIRDYATNLVTYMFIHATKHVNYTHLRKPMESLHNRFNVFRHDNGTLISFKISELEELITEHLEDPVAFKLKYS